MSVTYRPANQWTRPVAFEINKSWTAAITIVFRSMLFANFVGVCKPVTSDIIKQLLTCLIWNRIQRWCVEHLIINSILKRCIWKKKYQDLSFYMKINMNKLKLVKLVFVTLHVQIYNLGDKWEEILKKEAVILHDFRLKIEKC